MPRFADLATLTRQDLRHFDSEAKELVDLYHAAGWRSYLSGNGHAIMQAPDGHTTASVGGHANKSQVKAGRGDLERWLRRNGARKRNKAAQRTVPKPRPRKNSNPKPQQPTPNHRQEDPMSTPTDTRTFVCLDCPDREPFKTGGALGLHRQRTHGMQCPECGLHFTGGGNAARYNAHRYEKHGVEPKDKSLRIRPVDGVYPCPWCKATFGTAVGVGSHVKVHKGQERPVQASSNGASNGHTTPDPQPSTPAPAGRKSNPGDCPVCGEHFTTTNGLNGHMKAHKKPQPAPQPAQDTQPQQEQPTHAQPQPTVAAPVAPAPAGMELMDGWLATQDAGDMLAQVLAIVAAPLVGHVERLRRERDELTEHVETLRSKVEEYEAKLAIMREAMGL